MSADWAGLSPPPLSAVGEVPLRSTLGRRQTYLVPRGRFSEIRLGLLPRSGTILGGCHGSPLGGWLPRAGQHGDPAWLGRGAELGPRSPGVSSGPCTGEGPQSRTGKALLCPLGLGAGQERRMAGIHDSAKHTQLPLPLVSQRKAVTASLFSATAGPDRGRFQPAAPHPPRRTHGEACPGRAP